MILPANPQEDWKYNAIVLAVGFVLSALALYAGMKY